MIRAPRGGSWVDGWVGEYGVGRPMSLVTGGIWVSRWVSGLEKVLGLGDW